MTISTKPKTSSPLYSFSIEELELIGALACMVRLTGPYGDAAYSIATKLSALSMSADPNVDFSMEAYQKLNPMISVEDSAGNIETYDGMLCTIEV